MKIRDKIITAFLLVLFTVTMGETARRIIVGTGDIVHFDKITRYGVDSMAGTGLVGTDTDLQYDSGLIYNKTEVDALVGGDTGVQLITAGNNLTNSGTEKQPILDVDDVFYTKTESDALLLDKADTPHTHDDRYYSESEIDALLLDKADTPHTHDDRYYTETELDNGQLDTRYYTETETNTLLSDKVALADSALHQHVEADITDLDKYTTTEVDNLLDDKLDIADSTLHTHTESDITDLDKYTTSEVDDLLADKMDSADSVVISDIAYNATTWDLNTDGASKNAIRDKVETMDTAIDLNTAKETNTDDQTIDVFSISGNNVQLSLESDGEATKTVDISGTTAVGLNTAKNTNVSTALSEGTRDDTTYGITSDGGADDLVLPQANTNEAGLLSGTKFDEIVANTTAKHTQGTDEDLDATFEATFVKKTDTVNVLSDITSTGADIEDAVTKKHASASDNQNLWEEIRTDTGTTTANSQTDTLWITGGNDIGVYNSGDTIIIDYEGTGAGGGAVAWGAITGTLSAQTDLEARLTNAWKERRFNAFRIGNYEYMIDGFTNDFTVENEGIDTALSDTYLYDATGDYYRETSAGSTTELDYMEYATDDSAQAAYVSSDIYGSDVLTGGTPSADSVYLDNPTYAEDKACDDNESTRWVSEDTVGFPHWWKYDLGNGVTKIVTKVRIYPYRSAGENVRLKDFKIQGSNNDSDWTDIHTGQQTNDLGWQDYTFANENAYRYNRIYVTTTWDVGNAGCGIYEIEMMETHLQCYSEDTIKEQGTYSLKAIAAQTDSLNDTLTRTVSPTIDLTGKTSIKYYIYSASRTGSQIKIGIHDSGGTTTEHTANISSTSAWELQTWDISGVSNANKDVIDSIIVTVLNADAANTFYLDNVYGNLPASSGGNMELFTEYFDVGITPTTIKAMILSNAEPTSVYLTRTGTGTTLTAGVLADSDVYSSELYSFNYSASVSGENSDTCLRALIVADTSVIHVYGISLIGYE